MINDKLKKAFAKKWKVEEEVIFTIYRMIEDAGRRYGKVSKTLKSFNIKLSSRQLKYFYRKSIFYNRIDFNKKGRPKNYLNLLRKST